MRNIRRHGRHRRHHHHQGKITFFFLSMLKK